MKKALIRYALFVIGSFFLLPERSTAQLPATPATELVASLQQNITAPEKAQIYLQLTLYYYFDHNEVEPNLDKMYYYLQQAQSVNNAAHSTEWQNELNCYFGKYYLKIGYNKKADNYFKKIEDDIGRSGDPAVQIEKWSRLGGCIRALDTSGITRNYTFSKRRVLYEKAGNREKVIEMDKAIADTHLKQGNLDLAETELLSVLDKYKSIGFTRLHYTYNLLSSVNWFKGNYNTALRYALLTIESMLKTQDSAGLRIYYCHLACLYDELGQEEKSAEYFNLAANHAETNPIDFYAIRGAGMYARVLVKQHKLQAALLLMKNFIKKYPPVDSYGKASLARTMALCYRASGDPAKAEKYILEMIELMPSLLKNNEITQEVAFDLGTYFLDRKEFTTAYGYFNLALAEAAYVNSVHRKKDVYFMLFKTDSALGHYVQAIQNLNQYIRLSDSTFTVVKNRQLQEVQTQYETEKKDKDLSLKDKNIQLLTKQSQLQLANLHTEKNTRNMMLVCTGLLILLLTLSFSGYKLKQKVNTQLEKQQASINEKNNHLEHLLQEKEWLVKEIHHRVKNNFHTVMGLLGTQSGYLRNEEAIAATAESQQRIQAMSLIHQKLYQSENMSDIDMEDYIHELVDYLKDSLNTGRRIQFHFQLDHISLGVNHAIPIGLILNETITNAIKYAFPGNRNGNVNISFTAAADHNDNLLLKVSDDGIGLPAGFDNRNNDTMGLNLMKGLAKDIDGQFSIYSADGTTVTVAFNYQPDLMRNPGLSKNNQRT